MKTENVNGEALHFNRDLLHFLPYERNENQVQILSQEEMIMKQIAVFLAEGFEEIEGLTVTDLLRRAGVTVTNVSVTGEKTVHGSHGIGVEADALFEEMEFEGMDMLVLPGGMPGTKHLKEHRDLCALLKEFYAKERYLAAISSAYCIWRTGISGRKKSMLLSGHGVRTFSRRDK